MFRRCVPHSGERVEHPLHVVLGAPCIHRANELAVPLVAPAPRRVGIPHQPEIEAQLPHQRTALGMSSQAGLMPWSRPLEADVVEAPEQRDRARGSGTAGPLDSAACFSSRDTIHNGSISRSRLFRPSPTGTTRARDNDNQQQSLPIPRSVHWIKSHISIATREGPSEFQRTESAEKPVYLILTARWCSIFRSRAPLRIRPEYTVCALTDAKPVAVAPNEIREIHGKVPEVRPPDISRRSHARA